MRDTIDMAREAGYGEHLSMLHAVALNRFEALVRADEREACAKVCLSLPVMIDGTLLPQSCAAAIRARGNT
jgi:hypothetical protein